MLWETLSTGIGVSSMALTMVQGTAYFILVFMGYSLFGVDEVFMQHLQLILLCLACLMKKQELLLVFIK